LRRLCLISILLAGALFAWEFVPADGFWLSAKWLPEGEILLTGTNYRGLFIHREGEQLDTISLDWKAGYRSALSDDGLVAFTGYEEFDLPGCVRVFDTRTGGTWDLHCGRNIGPPSFSTTGDIVFSNSDEIFIYAPDGRQLIRHTGGAYIVLPVEDGGFFFCDRGGIAYHYTPMDDSPVALKLPGEIRFTFAPEVSRDGRHVVFEDIGGSVFMFNPYEHEIIDLGKGDRPVFVEEPFGVIMLQLEDDGEEITEGRIVFVRIENGEVVSVMSILENLWGHIITNIDYSPLYGLLMTTLDGRIIAVRDLGEVFK